MPSFGLGCRTSALQRVGLTSDVPARSCAHTLVGLRPRVGRTARGTHAVPGSRGGATLDGDLAGALRALVSVVPGWHARRRTGPGHGPRLNDGRLGGEVGSGEVGGGEIGGGQVGGGGVGGGQVGGGDAWRQRTSWRRRSPSGSPRTAAAPVRQEQRPRRPSPRDRRAVARRGRTARRSVRRTDPRRAHWSAEARSERGSASRRIATRVVHPPPPPADAELRPRRPNLGAPRRRLEVRRSRGLECRTTARSMRAGEL
jgi:hypothetical protein